MPQVNIQGEEIPLFHIVFCDIRPTTVFFTPQKMRQTWSEGKDKRKWSLSSCDSCCRTWSENMIIREVKRWGGTGAVLSSQIDMLSVNPYFCQPSLRCSGLKPQPSNPSLNLTQRWPTLLLLLLPFTQTLCNRSLAGKTPFNPEQRRDTQAHVNPLWEKQWNCS